MISGVSNQLILLSCLSWGKGHVTRSIGIVQQLINQHNKLIIAGDAEQIHIFSTYFPEIKVVHIEKYPFVFAGNGNFSADLWKSREKIRNHIHYESEWVTKFIQENEIDLIISDHRYGFYSSSVKSIFVTHQLNLALNWWQFPAQFLHHKMMRKFNEIWVLDTPDSSLAGKLSHSKKFNNVKYIGHFSRFMMDEKQHEKTISELVICNGPKPYDEQLLLRYFNDSSKQIIAPTYLSEKYPHANIISSDDWLKCDQLIQSSEKIYAYCGYSTLMDLKFLKCEAELFPTKGQSEQEYLAELHHL
jgi:hypothetical protein